MAISARFNADFSDFVRAVKQADVELELFDASARNTERSLSKMVNALSGNKLFAEAQVITEAISRIGSPARLTADELQRVGRVAEEAAEKFRRWGQEPPRKIQMLADAAKRARGEMDSFRQSFQQVDGALASVGINLGPIPRGIDDIASASGKTASELGKFATAALGVSAGFAGWNIGRWFAGLAETDKMIGDFTAKLLGWGDVADQEAAAGADILARASQHAGMEITDMAEAMRINAAAAEAMIAKNKENSETTKRLADEADRAAKIQQSNLDKLAGLYHQANEAGRKQREDDDKTWAQITGKRADDAQKTAALVADAHQQEADGMRDLLGAYRAVQEADIAALQAQVRMREEAEKTKWAIRAERLEAEAFMRSFGGAREFDLSTAEGMAQFRAANPTAEVNAPMEYFQRHSLAEAIAQGKVKMPMIGDTRPDAFRVPPTIGGTSSTRDGITNHFHISGVFDPASAQVLGRTVSQAQARAVTNTRSWW